MSLLEPQADAGNEAEELIARLARVLGQPTEQLRAAISSGGKHDWRAGARNLLFVLFGAACLMLSAKPPAHLDGEGARKFFEHLGVALIVAVAVAELFHRSHQQHLIEEPTRRIVDALTKGAQKADRLDDEIKSRTDQLAVAVSGFSNILQFAKTKGIVGAFDPESDEWRKAIAQIVQESGDFLYVSGRSLRSALVSDQSTKGSGWLGEALTTRLHKTPGLNVAFLLADVFDLDAAYRDELKLIFNDTGAKDLERLECRLSVQWILRLIANPLNSQYELSLRVLTSRPSLFMVMSDKAAVVGQYIPYKPISAVRMIKIEAKHELFTDFKDYFETSFALAVDPRESIGKYIGRRNHRDDDVWEGLQNTVEGSRCSPAPSPTPSAKSARRSPFWVELTRPCSAMVIPRPATTAAHGCMNRSARRCCPNQTRRRCSCSCPTLSAMNRPSTIRKLSGSPNVTTSSPCRSVRVLTSWTCGP